MKPPRQEGASDFSGMDTSLADTVPAYDRAVLDVGSNHERTGSWRTRRGWSRGFAVVPGAPITLIKCWEPENELALTCFIATTTGYYSVEPFVVPTTGYGFNGYGSQTYGD